jgi:hypothetical protein
MGGFVGKGESEEKPSESQSWVSADWVRVALGGVPLFRDERL